MKKLLAEFKKLNLPADQYAIYGSGPMGIRRIRKIKDLDIIVKDEFYQKLAKKYHEFKPGYIEISNKIAIYASWHSFIDNPEKVIDRAEEIDGFKFIRLDDLAKWKKKMGREKDLEDIRLIKRYLKKNEENPNSLSDSK